MIDRFAAIAAGAVLLLLGACSIPKLVESNSARENLIITSLSGHITVYTEPGWHWQGLGEVIHYPKRATFSFSKHLDTGSPKDESLQIRFNDSGTAQLSGILEYALPNDPEKLKLLHSQYQSAESVQINLIKPNIQRALFNTGSILTSTESYSTRRSDMHVLVREQIIKGLFVLKGDIIKEVDKTNLERTVSRVNIQLDPSTNLPLIAEDSPFKKFDIQVQALNISDIDYDDKVDSQIQAQLDATIKVQTAIAEAKKAEQDTVTAKEKGKAEQAIAEASANVEKARAVIDADKIKEVALTKALQEKEVATLSLETAKLEAQSIIERGKADAESRKLIMEADGGLEKRLTAYTETQKSWASAFSSAKGPLVPSVIMGDSTSGNSGGLENLMQMLSIGAAKSLSVEVLSPK